MVRSRGAPELRGSPAVQVPQGARLYAGGQTTGGALASFFKGIGADILEGEVEKAKRAGLSQTAMVVNEQGDIAPMIERSEGTGPIVQMFNRAAEANYQTRMELAMRERVAQIANQNPADPAKLTQGLNAWSTGVRQTVPADMQAQFDLDFQRLSQPAVQGALSKRIALDAADRKAAIEATGLSISGMAAGAGQEIAQNQGNTALVTQRLGLILDHYGKAQRGIVGNVSPLYSPVQAALDLKNLEADFVESFIRGSFEGSNEKGRFFNQFLRGDIRALVPEAGEDGMQFGVKDLAAVLPPEKQESLRVWMSTRVSELHTMQQRGRTLTEQAAEDRTRAYWNEIYRSDDPTASINRLLSDPGVTPADKRLADSWLRQRNTRGADETLVESYKDAARTGNGPNAAEMRRGGLTSKQIDEVQKIAEQRDQFDNDPVYKQARGVVDRAIPGSITSALSAIGLAPDDARARALRADQASRAKAQLETELYEKTREALEAGYTIRAIPGGKVEETRGEARFFDPSNWIKERMKGANERLKARSDVLRTAGERVKQLQGELDEAAKVRPRTAESRAKETELNRQLLSAEDERRRLRRDPRTRPDLADILIEELD